LLRGGENPLGRPLTRVTVDGRPVRSLQRPVRFATPSVALAGHRITVRLPPGERVLELSG
jgi:hypothetical protein